MNAIQHTGLAALVSTLLLACGAPPPGARPPGGPGGPGGAEAAGNCDPAQCSDFCYYASGCIDAQPLTSAQCEAKCQESCGNAFFDDRDTSLMTCVVGRASVDLACAPMKECCAKDFTSELCKDVPKGDWE